MATDQAPCPGCGSCNQHHFSVRVGETIPSVFVKCPHDTERN